jgi:hypothetical protein
VLFLFYYLQYDFRRHRDVDAQTLRSMHAQEISQLKLDHIDVIEQERQRHDADASVLRGQLEAMRGELQNTREALEQQVSGESHAIMR